MCRYSKSPPELSIGALLHTGSWKGDSYRVCFESKEGGKRGIRQDIADFSSPFEVLCLYSGAFSFLGVMPLVSCCDQSPGLNGGYSNQIYPVPQSVLQNSSHWVATAGAQLVLA